MQKNKDGSVTLTKEEFEELNQAYQDLYDILTGMPSSIEDVFVDEHERLVGVYRWAQQLAGEKFVYADHFEDEEKE